MYIAADLSVVSHVQHFLQQLLTAAACFIMTRACVMVFLLLLNNYFIVFSEGITLTCIKPFS